MTQNEVPYDFLIFAYIMAVNLSQLYGRFFDALGGLQPAGIQDTCLEAVANYLEATLKVLRQTRGSEWSSIRFPDFHIYNSSGFGSIMRDFFDVLGGLQPAKTRKTCSKTVRNHLEAILKVLGQHSGSEWSFIRFPDFHLYNSSEFGSIM